MANDGKIINLICFNTKKDMDPWIYATNVMTRIYKLDSRLTENKIIRCNMFEVLRDVRLPSEMLNIRELK